MSDPLASWSIPERESLKDCIRLGIWSHQLAQTALPARSVEEIAQAYGVLQEGLQRYWGKLQLSPSKDESEMQFTLACLWDLGKRVKQGKGPDPHDLCPTLPKEQERQLKQLIQRYRKDSKQIAAQLMSPKKQGTTPARYNIQLIPKNQLTEIQMTRFGYNSKLQLNVGKTKKISSVIVHLQKKWKAAMSDNITLRLYPAVQGGGVVVPNFSWTENDKCVIVSRIYTLLQCRQGVIRLDYELVDETQPTVASAVPHHLVSEELLLTPSLEANFSEFLNDIENFDTANLSTPTPTPSPSGGGTLFSPEEDQNFLRDLPSSTPGTTVHVPIEIDVGLPPSSLPDEDVLLPLPTSELDLTHEGELEDLLPTPFQPRRSSSGGSGAFPTSFDELSQDAFHLRDKEYEGKCRDYWYQCEESLDYSSYFSPAKRSRERPGQGPSKKKQKLSLHPL